MNTALPAGPLLASINSPKDLRKLPREQLTEVCKELRQFIIDNVSVYGGHFAGSLGVVELTVALHYVYQTPYDRLVWDVGHQAYGHKILTGRRDVFHTNRMYKGISGFPRRSESEYDTFGVGHSSTSISAALGMAIAAAQQQQMDRRHVAIIGDGAMTGGISFEAMNHAGASGADLLIVLNDNCMSIDPNVGALKDYLTELTLSPTYNKLKDEFWNLLSKLNSFGKSAKDIVSKIEHSIKGFVSNPSNFFQSLKLRYFGPVDGHDVERLVHIFNDMKGIPGPKLLHCLTVKGKGFQEAEKDQTKWHAPGKFDKVTGRIFKKKPEAPEPPKYQDVFGHTLLELAEENAKIIGITPAMPSGSSMNIMMKAMPTRAWDVGIAEQHAVTFSAGLATQGMIPFCNIYSTFMQRAYDQVIHDVCIQNLPVNFFLDRAGLAGADGATHHGAYDMAYLRCVPHAIVAAPMDESELRNLMYTAQLPRRRQAFFVRYPRGQGTLVKWRTPMKKIPFGTGRQLCEGVELAILSIGTVGHGARRVCERLALEGRSIALYDMRFVKPLDEALLHEVCQRYTCMVTLEDGCVHGGFSSAILEFMAAHDYHLKIKRLGIPDTVIEHGTQEELYEACGYHEQGLMAAIKSMISEEESVSS